MPRTKLAITEQPARSSEAMTRRTIYRKYQHLLTSVLLIAISSASCSVLPSHVHNEANAKTALKAEAEMIEYAKNAPTIYTAMLANLEKFRVEEEYLLTELATNFHTALTTKLPSMNWDEFRKRLKYNETVIQNFKQQIQSETESYLKSRGEAASKFKDAQEAVRAANKAVQDAKEKVTAWNAYVALLQQGFSNLAANTVQTKESGVEAVGKAAQEVAKETITFKDADGKTVQSTVKAILADRLPSVTLKAENDSAKLAKVLPDAPGIGLVVMNLGLGLAQLEERRAATRLSQLSARAVLFEDALAAMSLAEILLNEVTEETNSFVTDSAFPDIAETWQKAATARSEKKFAALLNNNNTIADTVLVLRKAALAESIIARNQSLFKVAVARLEHQDSIMDSAVGDAAWQAVIKNGLDGLVAYHQSGFTREDAANIIRIAQTIALGFIAGGTN
jgi:hypothetical protein